MILIIIKAKESENKIIVTAECGPKHFTVMKTFAVLMNVIDGNAREVKAKIHN